MSEKVKNQEEKFIVSRPPYIKTGETIHCLMFDILIVAGPIIFLSIYFYGLRPLWIILLSVLAAVGTETIIQIIKAKDFDWKNPIHSLVTNHTITFTDGSALVTGVLLAFTLPVSVPFWVPPLCSIVAIAVGKQVFGGVGNNIFNPALVGRAFLLASWPSLMTTWVKPQSWSHYLSQVSLHPKSWFWIDAVTQATPLSALKTGLPSYSLFDLFIGRTSGCIGEISALAIILGAIYLLYKGTITRDIPIPYIGTVFLLTFLLGKDPLYHILSGGLMLGAFYMATDPVTSPMTKKGRLSYGFILGIITVVIRNFGAFPEGVCYSILIGNGLTPLIDRVTRPKPVPLPLTGLD